MPVLYRVERGQCDTLQAGSRWNSYRYMYSACTKCQPQIDLNGRQIDKASANKIKGKASLQNYTLIANTMK